jgi:hypothetical protein
MVKVATDKSNGRLTHGNEWCNGLICNDFRDAVKLILPLKREVQEVIA